MSVVDEVACCTQSPGCSTAASARDGEGRGGGGRFTLRREGGKSAPGACACGDVGWVQPWCEGRAEPRGSGRRTCARWVTHMCNGRQTRAPPEPNLIRRVLPHHGRARQKAGAVDGVSPQGVVLHLVRHVTPTAVRGPGRRIVEVLVHHGDVVPVPTRGSPGRGGAGRGGVGRWNGWQARGHKGRRGVHKRARTGVRRTTNKGANCRTYHPAPLVSFSKRIKTGTPLAAIVSATGTAMVKNISMYSGSTAYTVGTNVNTVTPQYVPAYREVAKSSST
jgi:hypothetical protein